MSPVYVGLTRWRDPEARDQTRPIFIMGFDPSDAVFDLAGVVQRQDRLRLPDVVLFDEHSRPEFGRIPALLGEGGVVRTEVGTRSVSVEGLFRLGTSFGVDGSLITSDLNFLRIFAERAPGRIDLGLIQLAPGVDPQAARATIAADLPNDVDILTRAAFVEREIGHWKRATPVGYVFGFGAVVGLLVGSIVVYQILFTDVNDHIREYATLKAMGHRDRFLFGIVIQQAALLAALGFTVGTVIATILYRIAGDATRLPMQMEISRSLMVFAFTVAMCCIAGAAALVRVRSADPAEVF